MSTEGSMNYFPCIFYMDFIGADKINCEYYGADYESGWYYQVDSRDMPVGPFDSDLQAEEAISDFFKQYE